MRTVVTTVVECDRCGMDHNNMEFTRFFGTGPENGKWTHWAMCSNHKEPVLLRIGEDNNDED